MYKKETDKIKHSAQLGLWGSAAVVILASLFLYASPWRFPMQSDYVNRWMLVAGSVLAVLSRAWHCWSSANRYPGCARQKASKPS